MFETKLYPETKSKFEINNLRKISNQQKQTKTNSEQIGLK